VAETTCSQVISPRSVVTVDLGAPVAGAARHGLGEVRRLDVAILAMLDGADDAVRLHQRPDLLHLGGCQEFDGDADGPRDAGVIFVFVHPVLRAGEPDVGDVAEAGVEAGFLFEGLVEVDRVFVELTHRVAEVEQRQQAGGVPGGARGQFAPLDEDHVAPALLREVVERADADCASADDDNARLGLHKATFGMVVSSPQDREREPARNRSFSPGDLKVCAASAGAAREPHATLAYFRPRPIVPSPRCSGDRGNS
jgi:hypothetical protein